MLTRDQADAVILELRGDISRTRDDINKTANSGVQGALSFIGLSNSDVIQSTLGALEIQSSAVERLAAGKDAAVADEDRGNKWLDAARSIQHELTTYPVSGDAIQASIDNVLSMTAGATATDIASGVNKAAGFVWSAIPFWIWLLAAGGIGLYLYANVKTATRVV